MNRGNHRVRVLWVSDSPLVGSGFGRVTREVTTRLASVPGLELACLGWSYDGWPYERSRFPLIIYPSPSAGRGTENFERAVQEFKPDVVITLAEIWMIDWLHTHPLRPQFKWIGYFPLDGGPFYPPWEAVLKDVDELVTMSVFCQKVFQEGLPSRRIHVIYHGVDTTAFRPLPERTRLKSHGRFRDKFVIGCVARNQPRKNIPALVKVFAQLSEKIEKLHLFLHMNPCDVGYDIVTLLRRYGLEGRADVSGPNFSLHQALNDEQLNRLYNLFDVTVLPTMAEGFGLPILESFAAGVPVVATDCSACTELVRGRGELVRTSASVTVGANLIEHAIIDLEHLATCVEKVYRDSELAKQYTAAGLAFAQTLTWDNMTAKWLDLINATTGANLTIQNGPPCC